MGFVPDNGESQRLRTQSPSLCFALTLKSLKTFVYLAWLGVVSLGAHSVGPRFQSRALVEQRAMLCTAPSHMQRVLLSVLGCDLSFPGNKLVSGDHCKIIVDGKSGQVSLEDTR